MCLLIALTTDSRICDGAANGAAPSEQQILSCFLFCQVFCYIRTQCPSKQETNIAYNDEFLSAK